MTTYSVSHGRVVKLVGETVWETVERRSGMYENAAVAKLADALRSGRSEGNLIGVQVSSAAQNRISYTVHYSLGVIGNGATLKLEDHQRSNDMKIPSITRQSLSESQNHRCCYCSCEMTLEDDMGPTMATREHVIPRALGGPTEWWNLAAACNECNSLRGHMNALAFCWMRQTMMTEEIIHIRYDRLMLTFDRYEKRSSGQVVVVFNFLHRLFGHPPEIPVVPLKYRDRQEGYLQHNS